MKMRLSDFTEAVDLADIVTYRLDYSGPGLYGCECPAIIGYTADYGRFLLYADQVARGREDEAYVSDLAYYLAEHTCTDRMADETVYYWPSLEIITDVNDL